MLGNCVASATFVLFRDRLFVARSLALSSLARFACLLQSTYISRLNCPRSGHYAPPAVDVATSVHLSPALPANMDHTCLLRSTLPSAYTNRLSCLRSWTLRAFCGRRCHPRTPCLLQLVIRIPITAYSNVCKLLHYKINRLE